ncbi:MAG: YeeE/YedE thiosulfate transporter family protein [Myxococcaceae bacterium]
MEAIAPFSKLFGWSPSAVVAAAVFLGVGFGFVLEKAGFGNARILAGQWYGYNFAVLRVMFTAIVVAMVGLFGLHYAGILDLGQVYVNETFLWPQLVGGLVFGFGFVIGQYCPGTALVACATGKLDGMAYIGGFLAGLVLFFFAYPLLEGLYLASSMGRVLLPDVLRLPAGVVVLLVVLMALGAFALTRVLDRRFGNDRA